jgi:hypothetical protein
MPDDAPQPPIVVDPSVLGASAAMAVRQVALVGGGVVATAGYLHSHDWGGLFGYLSGDGAPAVFVALATIGVFAYGQVKLWRDRRDAVRMARSADDSVAVVKGEETA